MSNALQLDLKKIEARAFHRLEWAEPALRRYHAVCQKHTSAAKSLRPLYEWMFVPPTLWPFNVQDALEGCLAVLEKGKQLTARLKLLIEMLPELPDESVCQAVAEHESHVQIGFYEHLLNARAKFSQAELTNNTDPELRRQWERIKAAFSVRDYCDHKGVIRRSMNVERNLRPSFSVNMRRRAEVFQAVFDAFCLRWNLYGMKHDEPLLLKLSVNITPYGTMIHIPAYWSFDPKRDIRWDQIARLHRARVPRRQGAAFAQSHEERLRAANKLRQLDAEARQLGLKGQQKHAFLCAGLNWHPETSPKRLSRLRSEFPPAK